MKEFSFQDLMMRALLRERYEESRNQPWNCTHKMTNKDGTCCLCGRKVGSKAMRGKSLPGELPSNDELSYRYHWDPDFGTEYRDIWPV